MADIFREIDEDLRRDRLEKLWGKYGRYLLGFVALLLIAVAIFVFWRDRQQKAAEALGTRYAAAAAQLRDGQADAAIQSFESIVPEGGGYGTLARIEAASLKARSAQRAQGIAELQAVAVDTRVDATYRDMARVIAGLYELDDGQPAQIVTEMAPLTQGNGSWRFLALEVTALAQLKQGAMAEAAKAYTMIADDLGAPQALRARATEMAAALNKGKPAS